MKDHEETFSFRFLNLMAARNLLFILAGMPVAVWLLKRHPEVSLFLVLAIALVPMLLGLILFFTRITRVENVSVTDEFIDSKCYGKISLKSIRSSGPSWKLTQPNIVLTLKNRKKIRYASVSNETYHKDARRLQQFIDALMEALSKVETANEKTEDVHQDEILAVENGKGTGSNMLPAEKLVHSKSKLLVVFIPIVLIISGLLIYYALMPKGEAVPPRLSKESVEDIIKTNEAYRKEAGRFISDFQRQNGPFYLFTNDSDATIQYLPESLYYNFDETPEGYNDEIDSLRAVMANPESQQWHISIRKGDTIYMTKRGSVVNASTDNTFIYFIVLDRAENLKNSLQDQTSRYIASIPVGRKPSTLEQWIKTDPFGGNNMKLALNTLNLHPEFTDFYFVARNGEGDMNEELFRSWATAIKDLMVKQGIDSRNFLMKIID